MTEFSLNKVIIEVSSECGLDCCFCNADNYSAFSSCTCKRWNYQEVDIDYTNIVEQLIRFRVQKVLIIGGDPFFNAFERLKSLLNKLNEKGYTGEIVIMTNGQSLSKEKIEFISKFNYEIFRTERYREFWFLSKNKIERCRSCKYNTVCMDCRAIEYSVTHDLYAEYFCDEVSKISSIKKNNEGK